MFLTHIDRHSAQPRSRPRFRPRSWARRLAVAGVLALAAPLYARPATLAAQSRAELQKVLKRTVLANGLEVVVRV